MNRLLILKLVAVATVAVLIGCGIDTAYQWMTNPRYGLTFNDNLAVDIDHSPTAGALGSTELTVAKAMKAHGLREMYVTRANANKLLSGATNVVVTLVPCDGDCTEHDDDGNGKTIDVEVPRNPAGDTPAFHLHMFYSKEVQAPIITAGARIDPAAASVNQVAKVINHYAWSALDAHTAMLQAADKARQNTATWVKE